MSRWREMAEQVRRGTATTSPPATISMPGLPVSVTAGMATLRTMPTPRLRDRGRWRPIVEDAERLVSGGWAAQALGLGWHPLELFGWGVDDQDRYDGLATWLSGRRIVLLDDASVIVRDGDWRRIFNRQRPFTEGHDGAGLAVFLWQVRGA